MNYQFHEISNYFFVTFLLVGMSAMNVYGNDTPTLAESLLNSYREIDSITCEIRKTTSSDEGSSRMLSRIYFRKPGYIHVDNVSPVKKRIIADGEKLYYYEENALRGFSKPVTKLEEPMLSTYRNIPTTPVEHLLRLEGLEEIVMTGTTEFPVRRAYQAPKVYVVLSCDNTNRLLQIDFFDTPEMKNKTAQYSYSEFFKVSDHCWIPCRHMGTIFLPEGRKVEVARYIQNLTINKPVADNLFDAKSFFKDIEFTDDFQKTYTK